MRRTTLSVLSALAILLSGMIVPEAAAQSRRDKEQTYVLEKPYEVKKLVPPTGKKIKNGIFDFSADDGTEFLLNLTIDPCILNAVFSHLCSTPILVPLP